MLPIETIRAIRTSHNVVLDMYGIPVTLFWVTNLDTIESMDAYQTTTDHVYSEIETSVHIEWKKDMYRLRKLGLYTEGELPIIAHFPNSLGNIPIGSYIKIAFKYLPDDTIDTDEFEIISQSLAHINDAEPFLIYAIAPKRKV